MGESLPALTIWQPWATLIVEGAKPYEFRGWHAPSWVIGKRIAIHAGARPMRIAEVRALLITLAGEDRWSTGLIPEIAIPILERAKASCASRAAAPLLEEDVPASLPLASVLGTAILGLPTKNPVVAGHHLIQDSDRFDHLNWGWPLTAVERITPPAPAMGRQGFWRWERGDA